MNKSYLFLIPVAALATDFQVIVATVDADIGYDSTLQYGLGISEIIEVDGAPITGVEFNFAAKYATTATEYATDNSHDWMQISVSSPILMPVHHNTYFLVGPSLSINKVTEHTKFDLGTRFGFRHEFESRGVSIYYDHCRRLGSVGLAVFA